MIIQTPTITTPTIIDFTNATHNHISVSGGGILSTYANLSGSNTFGNYLNTFTDSVNISGSLSIAGLVSASGGFIGANSNGTIEKKSLIRTINCIIGDGINAIISGAALAYVTSPISGTISNVTLLADVSGSAVIDVWKTPIANFPPTVSNTITASAKPTLTNARTYQNSTLTGWTKAVSIGDCFEFNVDSVSSIKKLYISLEITT